MQLTKNFRLEEFLRSDIAARRGLRLEPNEMVLKNLTTLCQDVLQPIRDRLARPMIITSGYRPLWLNIMVKGSRESAHLDGRAADFRVHDMSQNEAFLEIRDLKLPIDQCITEFPPDGWIHVAIAPIERRWRGEYLATMWADGRVVYQTG
jgi:uncharacterized protein YcbK (DUF882 family)